MNRLIAVILVLVGGYFVGEVLHGWLDSRIEYVCSMDRISGLYATNRYQLEKKETMVLMWSVERDRFFMFPRERLNSCQER